jgi:hypothetical protein
VNLLPVYHLHSQGTVQHVSAHRSNLAECPVTLHACSAAAQNQQRQQPLSGDMLCQCESRATMHAFDNIPPPAPHGTYDVTPGIICSCIVTACQLQLQGVLDLNMHRLLTSGPGRRFQADTTTLDCALILCTFFFLCFFVLLYNSMHNRRAQSRVVVSAWNLHTVYTTML